MRDYQEEKTTSHHENNRRSSSHHSRNQSPALFSKLMRRYPSFVQDAISDLLQVDGYSEIEIAYGTRVSMELIRALAMNQAVKVDRKSFHAILQLYLQVFY